METAHKSGRNKLTDEQIFAITRPDPLLMKYFVLASLLTVPAFPFVLLHSFFLYRTSRFEFTNEGVRFSHGKFWRKETYLTYARIQDIHVRRNVIERWMGLATIDIQTASASAKPEMSIRGILEFDDLRDFLYARMRGAKNLADEPAETTGESASDLLLAIRDELRGIREKLEAEP